MFASKTPSEKTGLDKAIDKLFADMYEVDADGPVYAEMVKQMDTLYKLKEVDCKVDSNKHVSRDTLFIVGGNILGILLIVGHERANVITTKALSLLPKFTR